MQAGTRGMVRQVRWAGGDRRAAEVGALTSGCDGDSQKLRWPDFVRDGLAVGLKT